MDAGSDLRRIRGLIDGDLDAVIPLASAAPAALHGAQRHLLMAAGKRFRPLLCVLIAEGGAAEEATAIRLGTVAEIVHTASLILDDLPCMDDADLRRRRATVHREFGEDVAILAATGLLNRAFGLIAQMDSVPALARIDLVDRLALAVGSEGLIAGQVADIQNAGRLDQDDLAALNGMKTGALFDFCVGAATTIADYGSRTSDALSTFSHEIGQAFQLLDDMKDVLSSEAEAGKSTGRDSAKITLMDILGEAGARDRLNVRLSAAKTALRESAISSSDVIAAVIDRQFSVPGP